MTRPAAGRPIDRLIAIMATLRHPEGGCPWDLEQTYSTIAPYTIEEAYEVADAIERQDLGDLRDELGDLLLQVVFHARIAEEEGAFAFDDVAAAICEKMIRRHPHVFPPPGESPSEAGAPAARIETSADQSQSWERIKAGERAAKGASRSLLDDVPLGLPALTRAVKLSKRAARVGFAWRRTEDVLAKVDEELLELKAEIASGDVKAREEEFGDLLFVLANLARDLDIDPEAALRGANAKFVRRFGYIESALAREGRGVEDSSLEEMDRLWNEIRQADKSA